MAGPGTLSTVEDGIVRDHPYDADPGESCRRAGT